MRVLEISLGVPVRKKADIWMQLRPKSDYLHSCWEFPGGKLESHETSLDGMVRELREEISAQNISYRYLGVYGHDYPDLRVLLHCYLVQAIFQEEKGQWFAIENVEQHIIPGSVAIANDLKKTFQQDFKWNRFIKY